MERQAKGCVGAGRASQKGPVSWGVTEAEQSAVQACLGKGSQFRP